MADLAKVSRSSLMALADCLESGRLEGPFEAMALRRYVAAHECGEVAAYLQKLAALVLTASHTGVHCRRSSMTLAPSQRTLPRGRRCPPSAWW